MCALLAAGAGAEREHDVAVAQVWIGRMVRARPSCAICAILVASALVETASVATMASVVALAGLAPCPRSRRRRPLAAAERRHGVEEPATVVAARAGDDAAVAGSTTSPIALTATIAADRDAADRERRGAEAAAHRAPDAEQLADGRPGAGADVALDRRLREAAAQAA